MSKTILKQAVIFGGLLATTITLNAFAFDINEVQNGDKPFLQQFNSLDKNANETLNWSEAKADKGVKHKDFKTYDTDNDGTLTYQEYADLKTKTGQKEIKSVMSDSWITTKVKARLLEEEALKSLKISVETHKGQVLLSGFVSDASLKAKAEELVSGVEGVKSVKNAIVVKES